MEEKTPARIKVSVEAQAVKIHGPNSPDVIEGRVPEGHREALSMDRGAQRVELTEAEVRDLLGDEIADKWFPKGEK